MVKFKLNRQGVRELLKSDEMAIILKEKSREVKQRAGDGFEDDIYSGRNRLNAMVRASTFEARRRNRQENSLVRALFS